MLVNRLHVDIENVYVTKPLEQETYHKVMKENHNTIHSLYLITNELKSLHYFLSLDDHPEFTVSAFISVHHGYCGKAKQQISIIKGMEDKFKRRASFTITYKIIRRSDMKDVFSFRHISTSKKEIYNLIEKLHIKTEKLCKTNTY